MTAGKQESQPVQFDRRQWLHRVGQGATSITAASLLHDDSALAETSQSTHHAPKASRVVHLFMNGGPSQVDTFDYKPMLKKWHGKPIPEGNFRTERRTGAAMQSPFAFKKHGNCGLWVSELFEKTAQHIDDICVIRSMHAEVPNHEPSLMLMNCGDGRLPRPSFGSWVLYGLGTENKNLPGFVVMCPKGYPIVATRNWRSAFLPGSFQGTYVDSQHNEVTKLVQNIKNGQLSLGDQKRQLTVVEKLNRKFQSELGPQRDLEARAAAFDLAYRMQGEATDAFDFAREPAWVNKLYGPGLQAKQLIITRRLLERGVRFVQVWSGAGQPWDNHSDIAKTHKSLAGEWDQAIAGFLTDLKQRGLFESTMILWGGEFGRTPVAELPAANGRDHNHYGFTCWLAGGGVRGGQAIGSTDELGFRAVEDKVHVHDLHATMLHLLGFDHKRLTYRYSGRDFRLTDVHGKVVSQILG